MPLPREASLPKKDRGPARNAANRCIAVAVAAGAHRLIVDDGVTLVLAFGATRGARQWRGVSVSVT